MPHDAVETKQTPLLFRKEKPMPAKKTAHLDAPLPDEVEIRARSMMTAAERLADAQGRPRTPFIAERALDYYRAEAKRQLDMTRQRPADPASAPDQRATNLNALPGAAPCRGCGRAYWHSPSWKGTRADLCPSCTREISP